MSICLKNCCPFRLGATSYIIPADLTANARWLAPAVDDMELVLFEAGGMSNFPDDRMICGLRDVTRSHGLSYTVHFPSDVFLGDFDPAERLRSIERCIQVYELTRPLTPFAYIMHFHGDRRGKIPSADVPLWLEYLKDSMRRLVDAGLPPRMICVETLDYPFELVERIVFDHDLSICLDVGHILFYGHSLASYLKRYFERCRVVHLHGERKGEDHHDIAGIDPAQLEMLLKPLCCEENSERVMTLEVFCETDFRRSLAVLEDFFR
jgi:sugar phosphate isomerase/epimerase